MVLFDTFIRYFRDKSKVALVARVPSRHSHPPAMASVAFSPKTLQWRAAGADGREVIPRAKRPRCFDPARGHYEPPPTLPRKASFASADSLEIVESDIEEELSPKSPSRS